MCRGPGFLNKIEIIAHAQPWSRKLTYDCLVIDPASEVCEIWFPHEVEQNIALSVQLHLRITCYLADEREIGCAAYSSL